MSNQDVTVTVYGKDNSEMAKGSGSSDSAFQFTVSNPDLWTPDTPTLYNITVQMGDDQVKTYTGFRTITKDDVHGVVRPTLNGKPIFAFGTLDQGFWPDGIYTPPNYEAMKFDLQNLKDLGFNMVRKHIKVETDLFYKACDEMGLLIIQDMPSLSLRDGIVATDEQNQEFIRQWVEMIDLHKSFTCIWTWVIINEGWGQLPLPREPQDVTLTPVLRSLDPTRLIDSVTGWNDHGEGDFLDNHHYSDPQCGTPFSSIASSPYDPSRIGFQGEFGGIGHNVTIDHLWNVQQSISQINQTYELDDDLDVWNYRAHILLSTLRDQTDRFACSGGVWTQTTDVEGEVNGLLTYDRRILRPNVDQWKADIQAFYDAVDARANGQNGQGAKGAGTPIFNQSSALATDMETGGGKKNAEDARWGLYSGMGIGAAAILGGVF